MARKKKARTEPKKEATPKAKPEGNWYDTFKDWLKGAFLAVIMAKLFGSEKSKSPETPGEATAQFLVDQMFKGEHGIEGYQVLVDKLPLAIRANWNTVYDDASAEYKEQMELALDRHVDAISDGIFGFTRLLKWYDTGLKRNGRQFQAQELRWPHGRNPEAMFIRFWTKTCTEGEDAIKRAVEVFTKESRLGLAWMVFKGWVTGATPSGGTISAKFTATVKAIVGLVSKTASKLIDVAFWALVVAIPAFMLALVAQYAGELGLAAILTNIAAVAFGLSFAVIGFAAALVLRALGVERFRGNWFGIAALAMVIPAATVLFFMATPDWGMNSVPVMVISGFAALVLAVWWTTNGGSGKKGNSPLFSGTLSVATVIFILTFVVSAIAAFFPSTTLVATEAEWADVAHGRDQNFLPDGTPARWCFTDTRTKTVIMLKSIKPGQKVDTETGAPLRGCGPEDLQALWEQERTVVTTANVATAKASATTMARPVELSKSNPLSIVRVMPGKCTAPHSGYYAAQYGWDESLATGRVEIVALDENMREIASWIERPDGVDESKLHLTAGQIPHFFQACGLATASRPVDGGFYFK